MDSKNNTGSENTGSRNSGNRNSGNRNSGNWNSGNCNSGVYNTGSCNTGGCNSGSRNSGWFNTDEPKMRLFNKESDFKQSEIKEILPHWKEFYLNKWISESEMTTQEKLDNETFHVCDGYLKKFEYKKAWANFWRDTDEDNRQKFLNLPNFDAEIFEKITGINVNKKSSCSSKIVEIGGKRYELKEIV